MFPLTSLYDDKKLTLMVSHALTSVSTKLLPLCERWSYGDTTGKGQFIVSGFGMLQNASTSWAMSPNSARFNSRFFEEPNWGHIGAAIEPYENFIKEYNKLKGKPLYQSRAVTHFNPSNERRIISAPYDISDLLD